MAQIARANRWCMSPYILYVVDTWVYVDVHKSWGPIFDPLTKLLKHYSTSVVYVGTQSVTFVIKCLGLAQEVRPGCQGDTITWRFLRRGETVELGQMASFGPHRRYLRMKPRALKIGTQPHSIRL